jgi:hypothetical protein
MTRTGTLTFLSVLPIYFVIATALGFADYHLRPFPERGFAEYSPAVVAGTEEPPGKYRILAPYAYVGFQHATGLEPRDAWVIFRWLCLFGGLLATHFYLRTWVDQAGALAGTAIAALLLLLTMTNGWAHPDHFVEFALFTWACAEIARGRFGMLAIALALNALNRETAVFLLPLVALAGPLDRRRIVWTAILAAIWLGIYLGLRRWLGFVAYDPWQLGRNLEFLKLLPPPRDLYYRAYAWFWLPIVLPGVWLAARTWAAQPRFARVAIGVVVPLYFVVAALFSSIIESRIFTIFIPLTLPAIVLALNRDGRSRTDAV